MKKLVVFLVIAFLLFSSVPAFAAKGNPPGDGGFFTKFFQGILGTSWSKEPSKASSATSTEKIKKRRSRPKNWLS